MAFDFPASPSVGQQFTPSGGPTYQYNGTAWLLAAPPTINAMVETLIVATQPYTKPAGLKFLEIEGCAPGGGGSGALATGAGVFSFGSSGGGGAWGRLLLPAASVPASLTVTVAAPGGASANAGIAGGTSSFGALMSLPGGTGGFQGANTTSMGVVAGAGVSAAPSGAAGLVGGAGGAASGAAVNISSGFNNTSKGGDTPYGQGAAALWTNNVAGGTGAGWGWGGGGACNNASQAAKNGAGGGPGFFRIREYF